MVYNTILINLDIDSYSDEQIRVAWQLAQHFGADLIGFCAAEPFDPHLVDLYAVAEVQANRRQIQEIGQCLDAMRARFEDITSNHQRATWRGFMGNPTQLLMEHARAADLIVACTAQEPLRSGGERSVDIGTLIMSAGRPVLLPGDGPRPLEAKTVVVAWKDVREARRAVADALPLLAGAEDILVLGIAEGDREATRNSVADVVRFLMKHGVNARSDVKSASGAGVGATIGETALAIGADLIVSGGFGHSRLREWAFGGVTRSLLADGTVHRLMSN